MGPRLRPPARVRRQGRRKWRAWASYSDYREVFAGATKAGTCDPPSPGRTDRLQARPRKITYAERLELERLELELPT